MKVEFRNTLWYSKYEYRARFHLIGVNRAFGSKTFTGYLKHLKKLMTLAHANNWQFNVREEIKEINLDSMERYFTWRGVNSFEKKALIRSEMNQLSVFSNDLALLQTLEHIDPGGDPVVYTLAVANIPQGTKYFLSEPKHKYRLFLKGCRLPENSSFRVDLSDFIARYNLTATVMVPSRALNEWLHWRSGSWKIKYCQAHYSIDYDNPSTHTLLALMFGEMIASSYKLEKAPEGINTP